MVVGMDQNRINYKRHIYIGNSGKELGLAPPYAGRIFCWGDWTGGTLTIEKQSSTGAWTTVATFTADGIKPYNLDSSTSAIRAVLSGQADDIYAFIVENKS